MSQPQRFHSGDSGNQVDTSSSTSSSRSNSISRASSASWISHSNCLRSVSLKDSVEFEFDGNISQYALALGDCDNDQKNELAIGTLNGELLIYKDGCKTPLVTAKDLGMVACVLVGDILNVGWNCIISLSIEGYLKIFHLYNDNQMDFPNTNEPNLVVRKHHQFSNVSMSNVKLPPTISDNEEYSSTTRLILVHFQQMQANAMCAMLVDLDMDGRNEFVVALSDRVVRCYRTIQFGDEYKLIGLYKWEFSDQICSIALHYSVRNPSDDVDEESLSSWDNRKQPCIFVSQFGGVFAKISCCDNNNVDNVGDQDKNDEIERTVEYCHTIVSCMRNPQTNGHIISNIVGNDPSEELIAFATLDGVVILLNDQTVKWRLQLEHPILSLKKHDMNNDGQDELIVCTWNGTVYIIDLDSNFITCHFHEAISAFEVGHYHLNGEQINCFIYTTFTNSIKIYYNIDPIFNVDTQDDYLWKNIQQQNPKLLESLKQLALKFSQPENSTNDDDDDDDDVDNQIKNVRIIPDLIRTLLYEIPR